MLHVNHIGFRDDDPLKRLVLPVAADGIGFLGEVVFNVLRVSEYILRPLGTPEQAATALPRRAALEDTPAGRYAVCDLSEVTVRGGYQAFHDGQASYPFLIYRPVWRRCFRMLLEWYRIAACGEAAPGYHDACHLDDSRLEPDGAQADLAGGWHDAGDLRKWTSTMATTAHRLCDLVTEHGRNLEALGLDEAAVWRQVERGARYLLKCIDPQTGLVWHSIAAAADNSCNVWTDNVPNSGDERWSKTDTPPMTANLHVQAMCALAIALRERDAELSGRCAGAALRVWTAMGGRFRTPEASVPAELQLWKLTRDDTHRHAVRAGLANLLDRQVTGPRFGQDRLRGYFLANEDAIEGHHGLTTQGGQNLFVFAEYAAWLAEAILLFGDDGDAPRWREALTLLLEGCLEPMLHLSPYRVLPASLFARPHGPAFGRPLAGDLGFRYFGVHRHGTNGNLCNTAAALALCARALDEPRWAAYAQKQLEWVLGFNPFDASMLTGIGYGTGAVFSYYVGQIPGGIINGIRGDDRDEPLLALGRQCDPSCMEYWSIHTAAMLRALAILENQRLS